MNAVKWRKNKVKQMKNIVNSQLFNMDEITKILFAFWFNEKSKAYWYQNMNQWQKTFNFHIDFEMENVFW